MRVLDLFAGAGGASEGMKQAGFAPTLAVDSWKPALATHAANHDCEHLEVDINALDPSTLGRADFVWGSPPCPDFSVANSKRDPERGMVLVRKFLEVVAEVKPRLGWTMENVPGVADYLPADIPRVELLNAADYGTPQIRRRIFAGSFAVPRPTHAPQRQRTLDGRVLEKWVSIRTALTIRADGTQPRIARPGPGTNGMKNAVPVDLDAPANTIGDVHHEYAEPLPGYRTYTPTEAAVLQGFPPDYKWTGSKTAIYKQIGNAVPPPVARAIAAATLGGDR